MLTQVLKFSYTDANKDVHLFMDNDTPIQVAEAALLEFIQVVGKIKEQNQALAAQQATENKTDSTETTPPTEQTQQEAAE